MKLKSMVINPLGVVLVAFLLVSCGDDEPEPTPIPSDLSPTPAVAKSTNTPESQPTPTPGPVLSVPEMEAAVGFVVGHREITGIGTASMPISMFFSDRT